MSESLASFRELKGIGPATEARLHEAGIYTWEALGAAASALAAIRGDGDTLREVANLAAARRTEAGGPAAPRLPGGERLEAFVLRMALAADGEPRRCTLTHVRTMAEQAWAGWAPAELARVVEERSGLRLAPPPVEEPLGSPPASPPPRKRAAAARQPSRDHLVVLDAGMAIGGAERDIDLVVTDSRPAGAEPDHGFDYKATLAARRLGASDGWSALASQAGKGQVELPLRFPAVQLPSGVHRLQLRLAVNLATPARRPPVLTLG